MNRHLSDAHAFTGEDIIAFGSFQLNRTQRCLVKGNTPISLGSRAMEILLALTEKAGAILSNRELLRRVWPNIVVEDGTIRVHVAQLRKVLRDAEPESDYVHNVTGRGYRFVAPITPQRRPSESPCAPSFAPTVLRLPLQHPWRKNNLPLLVTSVFGRDQTIRAVADRVERERFVTVTGPGGSGKTTVAIGAAGTWVGAHANGVCFVDLAEARGPDEIWRLLGAALNVPTVATGTPPEILAYLSTQSLLLVLDNCEHVIEGATRLAESVLKNCRQVNILATSREPLRASGESIYELAPLDLPLAADAPRRPHLMESPAIRLFLDRATAYADTMLHDEELSLVANVCRRLGGNPLAIEIAAGQVRWLGLRSLAMNLHHAMFLSIDGRRTAARRHQTLRASFDWSYDLLTPMEQAVFRRLSVFAGSFHASRAAGVIGDERLAYQTVQECLITLARNSLLSADASQQEVMYRMDHLTRAYAGEKLHEAREFSFIHRRHSKMWRQVGVERIHAHARLWRQSAS